MPPKKPVPKKTVIKKTIKKTPKTAGKSANKALARKSTPSKVVSIRDAKKPERSCGGRPRLVTEDRMQMRVHVPIWVMDMLPTVDGFSIPDKLSRVLIVGARILAKKSDVAALRDFCQGEGSSIAGSKHLAAILDAFEKNREEQVKEIQC